MNEVDERSKQILDLAKKINVLLFEEQTSVGIALDAMFNLTFTVCSSPGVSPELRANIIGGIRDLIKNIEELD